MQVIIDANTRLVVTAGQPTPGNRNDCRAYTDSGSMSSVGVRRRWQTAVTRTMPG
jgi:hypothetical protein